MPATNPTLPTLGAGDDTRVVPSPEGRHDKESTAVRVLVVEDEARLAKTLKVGLAAEGFVVVTADNGTDGLWLATEDQFDVVVLDIMLPGLSGYEVLRRMRAASVWTPVLMLTAKDGDYEQADAFDLGADDYLTKPFGVHELLARVEALLRRARMSAADVSTPALPEVMPFGAATIDRSRFTATVAGKTSPLTARELRLAETFAAHPGHVLTRDALLNAVWGINYFGTTRTLDQHVAQLRRKVDAPEPAPSAIATVHGVGYRYDPSHDGPHASTRAGTS